MKKKAHFAARLICCALILVQLVALAAFGAAAKAVGSLAVEIKEYKLLDTAEAMSLNGTADERIWARQAWENLTYYDGSRPGTNEFSARFKAVWSKTHVYFLVEVTDKSVDTAGNQWYNDIVRLFVEESGTGTGTTSDGGYAKSTNIAASTAGSLNSKNQYTYYVKRTDTGYTVEASYAFLNCDHLTAGNSIRMEVHAMDHAEKTESYNEQHFWNSAKSGSSYYKADDMASLAGRGVLAVDESPDRGDATPRMVSGAGVRLSERSGLRFESRISKADYDALAAQGATLTVGTIILPTDYIPANGVLTLEGLSAGRYLNVVNNGWANAGTAEADGYYQFYGSIVDMKPHNLRRSFSAVSYLKIEQNGNTETLYSVYSEAQHARSVAQVAMQAAKSGKYDDQIDLLKEFYMVRINSNDLSAYRIVYPEGNAAAQTYANAVKTVIAQYIDQALPITSDSTAAVAHEILVGRTNRAESQTAELAPMEYTCTVRNNKLLILCFDEFSEEKVFSLGVGDLIGELDACMNRLGGDLSGMNIKNSLLENIPAAETDAYRFMQYNILVEYPGWTGNTSINQALSYRKEPVSGLLLNYAPDAAVLCEVFPGWRELLPGLLGDTYAFAEIDLDKGQANRTPIIYKKDKFTLLESGYRDIPVRNETGGSMGDAGINYRVVTWAVLQDKTNGQKLAVFGTHWEANAHVPTSDPDAKQKQAQWMSEEIAKITARYADIPVIAMGDFNSRRESVELQLLLDNTGLTHFYADTAWTKIDHIVFSNGEIVGRGIETENYASEASDHMPIWCDLKF